MTLEDNKALVRRLFEEVFPSGDLAAVHDLVAADIIDHDPLPGQPAGAEGIEYVITVMRTAQPDLRFTVDDLLAEADRVAVRWTMRGTNTDAQPAAQWRARRNDRRRHLPHRGRQDRRAVGRL